MAILFSSFQVLLKDMATAFFFAIPFWLVLFAILMMTYSMWQPKFDRLWQKILWLLPAGLQKYHTAFGWLMVIIATPYLLRLPLYTLILLSELFD